MEGRDRAGATQGAQPERSAALTGLTSTVVAERTARGEVNDAGRRTSRSVREIVRANARSTRPPTFRRWPSRPPPGLP
jgi:hypothetical protein